MPKKRRSKMLKMQINQMISQGFERDQIVEKIVKKFGYVHSYVDQKVRELIKESEHETF